MSIVVKGNNAGFSAFKARKVADLVRNKKAKESLSVLRYNSKKEIAVYLTKLLNSGLSIAASESRYDLENLIISKLTIDEGRTLKRIQPRAQGRAYRVRHRTSNITLELKEK